VGQLGWSSVSVRLSDAGWRTERATVGFTEELAAATKGNFQITTDGFGPISDAVALTLGVQGVDLGQLLKLYAAGPESETRCSPAECVECGAVPVSGRPGMNKVGTPHGERQNLTVRMQVRRPSRLTNAFSKKWEGLCRMLPPCLAWYDLVRIQQRLRVTPAMQAGATDHGWTVQETLSTAVGGRAAS
jgi:hypothetical protein